jgi:predicted MPP superfamily phosphohydrolase
MSIVTRARAAIARVFFSSFFSLVVIAASASQWTVVAWIAVVGCGVSLTWWMHAAGIAALYAVNRRLAGGPHTGRLFRAYTGVAFVCIFCSAFLLIAAASWVAVHGVVGAFVAQALTHAGQVAVGAGFDSVFRWVGSVGMTVIALTMGYGYTVGQRELHVTRVPLALAGLRARTRPLRIAQISDLHVGQNLSIAQLRRFVAVVNATEPDLICVTGDIADGPSADYATFFPILAGLRARHGVCAILGNHDHRAGAERVTAALRHWTSFCILRDGATTLDLDGTILHVIGLDDRGRDWARGVPTDPRLTDLLASAPAETPVLLLTHRPDVFHQASTAGVALTLAGHTHGGQLAIPWKGGRRRNLAEFITVFNRGLYRAGDAWLYVNSGLGVTGQRIRLFTPREISLFELTGVRREQ